jgi:hypothetical protein
MGRLSENVLDPVLLSLPWFLYFNYQFETNKVNHVFNKSQDKIILPLNLTKDPAGDSTNTSTV